MDIVHQVDVQRARLQAASIAAEVLAGRVSAVIGAVDLTRLRPSLEVSDDDPEFETFMVIDSECDGLPIGPVRQYWSVEALARKAPDVARAEQWAMETGREAFQRVVERFAATAAFRQTQAVNNMSEEEVVAFLNAEDPRSVFLFRFTDGTEIELSDPWVRVIEGVKRECIATVVREGPGVRAAAGSELCFALGEVADVRLSPKGFEHFR
jgi:hypothetical protein